MKRWWIRTLIALGVGVPACTSGFLILARGAESEAAREIKARYAKQVDRIKSLDVTYKLDTRSNLSAEKLLSLPEYMNQLFLAKEEWRWAFKGDKRYSRLIQPAHRELLAQTDENGLFKPAEPAADAPELIKQNQKQLKESYERTVANIKADRARGLKHGVASLADVSPSERDQIRAFNGRSIWFQRLNHYEVWPATSRPNWFQISYYLAAVGLHVPDPRGEEQLVKAQSIFSLASRIKDPSYDLEPGTEVVDGSTCVVLKGSLNSTAPPGLFKGDLTDRLWLDRDHGMVLRKREMALDGKVNHRWLNTDLKEVEPGIWLPMTTRNEQFPSKPVPDLEGKPVMVVEIRVQKLEINHVSDALFDMKPKQGAVIEDLRGGSFGGAPPAPQSR
jgi:hypothetical protein